MGRGHFTVGIVVCVCAHITRQDLEKRVLLVFIKLLRKLLGDER